MSSLLAPPPLTPLDRARRIARRIRRRLLAHRRLLAALLAGVAVLASLRTLAPPEPPSATVTIAAHDLAAGATLAPEDLAVAVLPRGSTPDGAVADPVGETLAAPVRRGEVVTDVRLVGHAATQPPAGLVATPVRLPDGSAVALLRAGDRIDLLATDARRGRTTTIAQRALVLGVPAADDAATGPLGGRIVLLALPEAAVEDVHGAAVAMFLSYAYADYACCPSDP